MKLSRSDVARVGLGVPGIINLKEGRLIQAPNLPSWDNVTIRNDLSQVVQLPVTLCNDANAAAFGEFWIGAGRVHDSLLLITLGTGVGGGIVINGEQLAECARLRRRDRPHDLGSFAKCLDVRLWTNRSYRGLLRNRWD